jgi:hypothetical protein
LARLAATIVWKLPVAAPRWFLNLPGFHGGAYVMAFVEDRSECGPRHLKTARLWEFSTRELEDLQEGLLALGMQKAGKDDLAGALVWVASRIPSPIVKTIVEPYLLEEAADYRASSEGVES